MENLRLYIRRVIEEAYSERLPKKVVAGALIKDMQTGKVLLIKRNDPVPVWAMATGKVDEGEDPVDAIEREMYEELFLNPSKVRLNYEGVEYFPKQNIEFHYFEAFVDGIFKPHLDEENLDFGWFSSENLPTPLIDGVRSKVEGISKKTPTFSIKEDVINEYITNNELYLRDYFLQSEDSRKAYLPHEYFYFFEDFLIEEDIDFERPKETSQSNYEDEPEEEVDMFDNDMDLIIWLENNNKELYNQFADYLYKKITHNELPIPASDYPAWSYFDDNPTIVKNQWLIHFTDDADGIASKGFKYGVDDMTKLGLTTHLGEFDKKYGGYNFAYLLSDFPRYARGGHRGSGYKYGKEAVIFRASGIKLWHHGDQEPQVIFYGNTATNIIPITEGDRERWSIRNDFGRIMFESDDLERVVLWLTKNYSQYRKQINQSNNQLVRENIQLADKVYFNTKKLSPRVREIITTRITNSDAWTKLITDIYWAILQQNLRQSEWIMHTIDNPGADMPERKEEYQTEDDVMGIEDWKKVKSYYQQLKAYNKNLFPIKDLNPNGVQDIWSLIRALDQRATILEKIKELPSIALRNMREDIRTPRDGNEMNQYRHNLEYFLAHYSLLNNRDAELKKFVERKMFKSGMTLGKLLSFVEEKENLLGGKRFDKDVIKDIIENNDHDELQIIYEQGNIMVVEVSGPYGIKEIGCNSLWCFTYGEGYSRNWSQYSYNDTVYVIIDFDEPSDSKDFMNVVIKPIVWNSDEEDVNDESVFDMSNQNRYDAIDYLSSTIGLDNAKKLLTFYVEPEEDEEYDDEEYDDEDEVEQENSNQLKLFEVKKQTRMILKEQLLSEKYLIEAIDMLLEAEGGAPSFTWDFSNQEDEVDEKSPEFVWDLAKEKIDLSKRYVKTKDQAIEYINRLAEKVKSLPKSLKIKLLKYIASSFVGLLGASVITTVLSSAAPDVGREVAKSIVTTDVPEIKIYSRPTQVSNRLLDFLKHEEGDIEKKGEPVLKVYKLGDGALTVGWGHAERIGRTKLRKGQEITRNQAEKYFREDVARTKSYVDYMLDKWEDEGFKPKITQSMYDAMVSMVYNMGIGTFMNSDKTANLVSYLKRGNFERAAEEIKKVSSHLYDKFPGLERRRKAEYEMFNSEPYTNEKDFVNELRFMIRNILNEMDKTI